MTQTKTEKKNPLVSVLAVLLVVAVIAAVIGFVGKNNAMNDSAAFAAQVKELTEQTETLQADVDEKAASLEEVQAKLTEAEAQVETLTKRGYDVLLFTEDVDEFVPQTLMTYMEKPFCNVSTEDLGLQTEEEKKQAEEKAEEMKGLLTFVKETLGDQVKEVKLSSELGSHPVCMTPAEGMSFEMEKYMKRANPEFAFPVGRVLELNPEHEAVQAMQKAMTEDPEKAKDYAKLLCYQAQLMAELPLDDPYAYTELVCRLMK